MSLDKILDKAEDIDLSGDDIRRITDGKCDVVSYHQLPNYRTLDDLLGVNQAVILLYETKRNFGHWVALFKISDSAVEFFDSYAFKPDEELNYARYNDTPWLTQLIQQSNYNIVYNDVRLQTFAHDINTCGRWTATRVKMRQIPLKEFQDLWKKNRHYNPDFWISAVTYLYTFK